MGVGAGNYDRMLNATRWYRWEQGGDCVGGWRVQEELVRRRLLWLWQAGASGTRAMYVRVENSGGWREVEWWMWLRIWVRGLVWWGEVVAAAVESWACGEGRGRRRPVVRWVSGKVGRGYRWWRKVVGGGQRRGQDGEGCVQAGRARERRQGRRSRGGTGDVEEGGRVPSGAGEEGCGRGAREGWDWVECDMVQEDVGAALTKPKVWVPEESPAVQAPYLCEEGWVSEEGVMGGWGWLEAVVRGTADTREGGMHWGWQQERGSVDEHMAEREWYGGEGVGRCDDEVRGDVVYVGDDWGEWVYEERKAKKWGGCYGRYGNRRPRGR